jgi:hypothetical protein
MASFLSNLFGGRGSSGATLGATRTVDLSGNKFSFVMPEDFSKDMPAENLVEQLDISDLKKFDNLEYGNLIRRWWDIKESGFFGKNLGTVMMDISVQRVPENKRKDIHERPYNILDRLDFLLMIDDNSHQRYDELVEKTKGLPDEQAYSVPSTAHLLGKEIGTGFRDRLYNSQKWIGYSVRAPENQLITGLVTPLTEYLFLEVVFTYAPDRNILPMSFLHFAYQKTQFVEDSLQINYEKNNTIQNAMKSKDWLKATNNQILQRHQDLLLIPFFGPDIHERLALQDQQIAEVTKAIAKWDDESETH